MCVACVSVARPAAEVLGTAPFQGRVLAAFDRACNLVDPAGQVVALVASAAGDGPFHLVLDARPGLFAALRPGSPALGSGTLLEVGSLVVDWSAAAIWEPRPAWERLCGCAGSFSAHVALLSTLLQRCARPGSLACLLVDERRPAGLHASAAEVAMMQARVGASDWLLALRAGDLAGLLRAAGRLAGLGSGLTPAGDDFLLGAMACLWAARHDAAQVCPAVAAQAAARTTTLSAAFLRAAGQGEFGAGWHTLLEALAGGDGESIERAALGLLAHGATSGADALAGFVTTCQASRTP